MRRIRTSFASLTASFQPSDAERIARAGTQLRRPHALRPKLVSKSRANARVWNDGVLSRVDCTPISLPQLVGEVPPKAAKGCFNKLDSCLADQRRSVPSSAPHRRRGPLPHASRGEQKRSRSTPTTVILANAGTHQFARLEGKESRGGRMGPVSRARVPRDAWTGWRVIYFVRVRR
jgi:hypothetical protein